MKAKRTQAEVRELNRMSRQRAAAKLLKYFGRPVMWGHRHGTFVSTEPLAVSRLNAGMCFSLHAAGLEQDERDAIDKAINRVTGCGTAFLSTRWLRKLQAEYPLDPTFFHRPDREVKALWRLVWLNHLAEGGTPQ